MRKFFSVLIHLSLITTFPIAHSVRCAEPDLGKVDEKQIMIPMRDGKKLSAWVYFPRTKEAGPLPVIFQQRYASLRGGGTREFAARIASAGYVVAMVNFRGTHDSEGKWVGYRALQWGKLRDGYDVCEWLAEQPWSNGKIGTFGGSQAGYAQNYLAVTQPPHLVCQYMVDTGLSLFQEGYRIGGTTRPERFKGLGGNCRNPDDNLDLLREWYQHPDYDEYWKREDCTLHFKKMNVPCFTIGSWFDFMNQGSIASFIGRQHHGGAHSRGRQWLAIGPWLHGGTDKSNKIGDLVFPETARWAIGEHMLHWFDYWLKGKAEAADIVDAPAVRYFVMGAEGEKGAPGNLWRNRSDWPPSTEKSSVFLHAGGKLSSSPPVAAEEETSSLRSDPLHPMEIPGRSFPGARDARQFEAQSDVITFTSDALPSPVEWTGRIFAELYVSSTVRDTDLIVRVSDVYPDGRSILLVDYPWRTRYREGFDHEVLMEPGRVYPVKFPVGWTSQVFNRGHRIRVTIASTGAPLYEPNPQNGKALTIDFPDDAKVATNSIYHSMKYPSRIMAPTGVTSQKLNRFLAPRAAALEPDEKLVYKTVAGRNLEMHVFHPPGYDAKKDRRPAFLIIHGGGWTGGEPRKYYPMAKHFAEKGMVTVSLQYRLLNAKTKTNRGSTVFDCVKDGRSAVRYLRSHAGRLGIDPDKIVVGGGSAGGHVAVGTALFNQINEAGEDASVSCRPDALILLNPVIDTSANGYGQTKIGDRWKELSPVNHVKPGLPPTILFHSTGDQVVPFSGAKLFYQRSVALGNHTELVVYEGGRHGYFIFDEKLYGSVIRRMEDFLRSEIGLE